MASISQIRAALVTTISGTVSGIQGYATMPESPNLPAFVVLPRTSDFTGAFGRGLDTHMFDVIVLVSRRDDQLAQTDLDDYVNGFGSESIRAAIFSNRTLGRDLDAGGAGMSDYGATWQSCGIDHVGARLAVQVIASGAA